ncbi:uncharacterized protein LOC116349120 [Contarinia nasturtii]|uniref:uncharacterized protein LOC116349120 n=1 Tax=Contarinia nasturtii TaxID=265458 RepID=UPI0012D44AF0|nr:uncharacterized protein LOC116349120 [Contarinia nasturtii]
MLTEHYKSKHFGSTMPKTLYNSSTPIKPKFDPVSKNSSTTNVNCKMNYEKIFPGIYMTSVKELCSPDDLKIYGFTHIIYIDKHIMANCIGSDVQSSSHNESTTVKTDHHENVIKCAETSVLTASITIRRHSSQSVSSSSSSSSSSPSSNPCVLSSSSNSSSMMDDRSSSKSTEASSSSYNHEMRIDDETPSMKRYASNENLFGHRDFETLDLNFGESAYFTANVLPNCYKAVLFIENALKNNGAVLVIDCIGENQKCITIVIGFLMYKYNKNFLTAYQLIKRLHPNIELDKFFTTQLYEYEPILQVQRSQSAGNSCSRELRSSLLKRKKSYDDCYYYQSDAVMSTLLPHSPFVNNVEQTTDILMEQ